MNVIVATRRRITDALAGSLYDNPVVIQAFRTRMRGWKAFVVMGAYVLLMAVVMMIAYLVTSAMYASMGRGGYPRMQVSIGAMLFGALTWVQTILLALIAPALSSGALTHELERKTLELMVLSPLSAGRIVLGKQLSSFLYALILLACSVPLAGMCLMFGGVSPMEIALSYLLLVAWVFVMTCSGVLWSSISRRTMLASAASFGLCFLYFLATWIGPPILMMVSGFYTSSRSSSFPFMLLNPALGSWGVMQSTIVCGVKVPLVLVAVTLHVLVGLIFLLLAMTHVRYKPTDRALPVRLLLLAVTAFVMWLQTGSATRPATRTTAADFGGTLLMLAMIAAAVFGTGVVSNPGKRGMLGWALAPRRILRSDIGGAIGFVALWTLVAYGTFGLTAYWQAGVSGRTVVRGFWEAYVQIGVSILVVAACMTALGVMASSLAKKRSSAAALVVLFAVAMLAGFCIVALNCPAMGTYRNEGVGNLAAFWPMTAILSSSHNWPRDYPTPAWIADAWIVTSVVYAVIGAIALLLASSAYRKTGGVVMEE